ncbi:MAG: hypothetical protein RIC30_07445 [Marinoscillum sp.]|uniref:hypothetical protein n=1 Tax=Marinoscillum sp. TaxID=2024838 RepID=UPI0032FE7442
MKFINIILAAFIFSCQHTNEQQKSKVDFFENELLSNSNEPLLNIYYQSDECGEWGGHEETMVISRNDGKTSYELTYQEYSVNCDSMITEYSKYGYYARPLKELVRTTKVVIDEQRKQSILNFSTDMVKSKFNEPFTGHSGVILTISNSDSTFIISTWGGTDKHYLKLVSNLELDE